jgi:kumamolisin
MAQGRNVEPLDIADSSRSPDGALDSTKISYGDALHKDVSASTDRNTDRNYVSVSVYLKSKASDQEITDTLEHIADGSQADYSQDPKGFDAKFGADPKALEALQKLTDANGLKITEADMSSGKVTVSGSAKQLGRSFGAYMSIRKDIDGTELLRHSGPIPIPKELADDVIGIFGLAPLIAGSPASGERNQVQLQVTSKDSTPIQTYLPNDVAKLYDFPMVKGGAGQGVAILEFGGSFDANDNTEYYKEHNLPLPRINIIGIDDAVIKSDQNNDEVNLDSQIVGAVAPNATQNIIFAPNTKQGFIDGVTRATFQPEGEVPNASVSLSWGMPESEWEPDESKAMRLAIQKAALKGINVYVAAGDNGAQDGSTDNTNQVQFPASVPEAIAVGGTTLKSKNGVIESETVWNDGTADVFGNSVMTGSGGGISRKYAKPFFQADVNLPQEEGALNNRALPDLAADANQKTGYMIRLNGKDYIGNGTSAGTPLYAAYNALINTENDGKRWGWLAPKLYQFGKTHPEVFRDVTEGDNGEYKARPGWDAASGWGSIRGQAFLEELRMEKGR